MIFKGSKKVLYDNAYRAYREIVDYIRKTFFDEDGTLRYIDEELPDYTTVKIATDIYIQTRLFAIAASDKKISEDERHFITSLIDNLDVLKKSIPGYKQFITKLDETMLSVVADNGFYSPDDKPAFLLFSVAHDMQEGTQTSYDLLDNLDIIFKCIVELEGLDAIAEKEQHINEMGRLTNFLHQNGLYPITEVSLSKHAESIEESTDTLEELLGELNSLIGLKKVKEDVESTINFIKVNEMRRQKGLHQVPVSNHMVFLGNPGTGKTTVARLLAKIYKELGVVSKGQLVETDRAGLVAGYVGQTALKTTAVVKKAIGGVLFIDEAYSLASNNDSNDFGSEAIDTLVKLMEDNREDFVVIVAGYNEEMQNFIESNPGLSSRFSRYFYFKDYSDDELIEIFKNICRKNGFVVSESAIKALKDIVENNPNKGHFGNARGVRNIFDKAILNQADRIMRLRNVGNADLTTIVAADLSSITSQEAKIKPNIGFEMG